MVTLSGQRCGRWLQPAFPLSYLCVSVGVYVCICVHVHVCVSCARAFVSVCVGVCACAPWLRVRVRIIRDRSHSSGVGILGRVFTQYLHVKRIVKVNMCRKCMLRAHVKAQHFQKKLQFVCVNTIHKLTMLRTIIPNYVLLVEFLSPNSESKVCLLFLLYI